MSKKMITKITSSIVLLCTMFTYTVPVLAFTKDETVYSKINSNGETYSTIVNDHIKNVGQEQLINDISDLLNIKNVNGDEEFSQNGNELVWSANGSDIYYQGESQKELPIECNLKYELEGEEITAENLAGKSGKVKITIEYVNKDEHIVNVNGKNEKLYTPFVVICGTILDNEIHKNIEITNGKLIDNGNKTVVIGMSLPGMQESLNISKDKIDIPNTVEITMDVTDFELNNIVTYVTPKVLEESDLEIFDKIYEIYGKVNTLQSSSKQLVDGASTLKDGANTYNEKSQEFNNAMKQISNGVKSANQSYSQIDDGISSLSQGSSDLKSGAEKLNSGINELNSQLTNLPESVGALYEGSLQILDGLNTDKSTGKIGLVDGVNSIISSLKTTTAGLEEALEKSINGSDSTITILKANNLTLNATLKILEQNEEENSSEIEEITKQIETNNKLIETYEAQKEEAEGKLAIIKQKSKLSESSLESVQKGITTIQDAIKEIVGGLGKLNTASKKLPSALSQLSNGSKSLAEGTKTLSVGASTLSIGSKDMKQGLNKLDTGGTKLGTASNQLTDGANTLAEGVTTLAEGITKFDKEGIETICNYINGDLKDVTARIEKLQELSEEYNNFTMLNDSNLGNVKFIMIMDSIKKSEENKQEVIVEEDKKKNN